MAETHPPFSGYATFSSFVASDPELSIFRGFQQLGSRNLLYLQSELLELENQLREFDQDDAQKADLDVMLSSKCWEVCSARAQEQPREAERMEVICRIRKLTKEYCWCLPILPDTSDNSTNLCLCQTRRCYSEERS
jgi:hypothetical protein